MAAMAEAVVGCLDHDACQPGHRGSALAMEGARKVGLLGTGFGIAHARIYHTHPQVSEVVVFGRTPAKLQALADEFGSATTTDLSSIYDDPAVDLVDVCLPTLLHAEHALRALAAGKHVLCEAAASIRPPSSCTPPSPRAATARCRA
jgi:shikimate 5-dehydrogenase